MKKIVKKHPLAIRWTHWINFPVLGVMVWSGLLIYWANDVYKIRLGGTVLFKFFPESVYHSLGLSYQLAKGMAFHFVFMWLFFLNGLIYVLYTIISGEWRLLVPNRHSFREAWQVLLYDLHIRRTGMPPQKKYNGAQRIAYTAIIVMGLGSLLSGLAIYKPIQFHLLCTLLGGYESARIIHFVLTIGYCLFFLIHIVQVILAGWNNFRGMISGFEVAGEPDHSGVAVERVVKRTIRRRTIVSFALFILLGTTAVFAFVRLKNSPENAGVQAPLRTVLDANEKVFDKTLSDGHLAKTYPVSEAARHVRVNGPIGMSANFDPSTWKLKVIRAPQDTLMLTLEDIKKLPKTEIVFDFKCIEGWSQVTHWGGVRFSDFVRAYHLDAQAALRYIGMRTPDSAYYVGIDMPSALHPQTLLCYEMNGKPLPLNQGYPLRMIIPVKYGIKSIKRIGTLFFSDQRPPDYWYERGYDYYSGL